MTEGHHDDGQYSPPVPGKCNARNRNAGRHTRCALPAGWGTDSPGWGNCRRHLGNTTNGRKAAAVARYQDKYAGKIRFGQVLPTNPMIGLTDEVSRSAGFIAYLESEIRAKEGIDRDVELTETRLTGQAPSVLVQLWKDERAHFARTCKMALDAGVAQAELDFRSALQGRFLDLVENIIRDLGHDPDDPIVSAKVVRQLDLVTSPLAALPAPGWAGPGMPGGA